MRTLRSGVWLLGLCLLAGCVDAGKVASKALTLPPESLQERQIQTRRFDTGDEQAMLIASAAVLQDFGFTMDELSHGLGVLVGSKQRDATNPGQVVAAIFVAAMGGGNMPIDKAQTIRVSLVTRPVARKNADPLRPAAKRLTPDAITKTCDRIHARLSLEYQTELEPVLTQATARDVSRRFADQAAEALRKELTARMNSADYGATSVRVTFQRVVVDTYNNARMETIGDAELYREFFEKLAKSVFLEAEMI